MPVFQSAKYLFCVKLHVVIVFSTRRNSEKLTSLSALGRYAIVAEKLKRSFRLSLKMQHGQCFQTARRIRLLSAPAVVKNVLTALVLVCAPENGIS